MLVKTEDLMCYNFHIHNINVTGILESHIGARYERNKRPSCALVLSTGGKYSYYIEDQNFCFEKDDILYLPADSNYYHIFNGENDPVIIDKNQYHTFVINFDLYSDDGERILLGNKPIKLQLNGKKYQPMFIDAFHQQIGIHKNPTRLRILLYQMLLSIGEEYRNISMTEQYAELIPALHHIKTNPIASIQVNDLIRACYISPTKFRQLFQLCEGITPQEYLDRMVIDASCCLLSNTTLPFKDIADRLGFSSPANFTKYFKKHKRITPTEYRKIFAPHY